MQRVSEPSTEPQSEKNAGQSHQDDPLSTLKRPNLLMSNRRLVGQTCCNTRLDETGSEGKDKQRDDERSDNVPWFKDGWETSDYEQDV